MLFKYLVRVHCGNSMKYVNTLCIQNAHDVNVKECGIYNYQCTLKFRLQKSCGILFNMSVRFRSPPHAGC